MPSDSPLLVILCQTGEKTRGVGYNGILDLEIGANVTGGII